MKKILRISGISVLCFVLSTTLRAQQEGSLDNTFGVDGEVLLTVGTGCNLKSVILQPDGKLLVGGSTNLGTSSADQFYIARMSANGALDPSFASTGSRIFGDSINNQYRQTLALAADGGILYSYGAGANKKPLLGKLTTDGASVFSVGPYSIGPASYTHNITGMSYNSTADRIGLVGFVSYTDSYIITSKHTGSGAIDNNFNGNGKIYMDNNFHSTLKFTSGKGVISMDDGSMLLLGISSAKAAPAFVPDFAVIKLRSDGTLDPNFGNAGISSYNSGSSSISSSAIKLAPDGKILVAGASANNFILYRLNADGSQDVSFSVAPLDYSGSNDNYTSISIQPDGKILASGTAIVGGLTIGIVVRYMTDGTIDQTFGTNGIMELFDMEINASVISPTNKRLILVGRNATNSIQMKVVALKYQAQKINILGKDIVSVESGSNFRIHPADPGYTYNWSYSSTNVYTLGTNTNDTLTLFFTKTTPSGTITCVIQDGSITRTVTKDITVNPRPSLAELLEDVQCEPAQTYAQDNYINAFKFINTKAGFSNSGASITGYSDYTASSNYDTLYTGDNYQAELECVTNYGGVVYCGLWIDYNNNGKLTDDEFAGSSASDSKIFTINNIVIPVDGEPGPKRVRVRARQGAPFLAYEACIPNEELSETEDYLVVLSSYDEIEAPNFITPNNDGKNDNFIVRGAKADVNNSLKVFNRVGDLVYEKENYDNSWGGAANAGGQLKAGTYYYVFIQPNAEKAKDDVVKGFFEIRY
jgi:gliding motility-associated-like protein/uncharacterized delta-60 repeat protein